ncbi:MAG: response regulator, partial [Nitrospirae bacterium]
MNLPTEQGTRVKSPLRILHLEDSQTDAELIVATLAEEGIACEARRIDTKADFVAALEQGGFDLIIADYSLPSFDGIAALALAREKCPDVPFIFVSATLGEELAIETLQRGATDYILKQRLSRLVPSVHRALRELEQRIERKRAEEALRQSEEQLRQSQKM